MKTSLKVLFLCLFIILVAFSVQSNAVQVMGGTLHRLLTGLPYEESGHTGFASSGAIIGLTQNIPNNASFTLTGLGEKNFSSLTNKPSTLAGYGITDSASTTALNNHIASTGTTVHGLGTMAVETATNYAGKSGANVASTAFMAALDQNLLGGDKISTATLIAYIATETSNRISSDTLKANTDGSNIASTAFALALDQEKVGISSTTVLSYIATETLNRNAAIATETLNREASDATITLDISGHVASTGTTVHGLGTMAVETATDYAGKSGANIASTSFTNALDQVLIAGFAGGISSATAQGYVDTHASLSANVHGWGPMTRETHLASAGQTVFTLVNPYIVGNGRLFVYNNGIYQETTDYTETDANTVTFTVGIPDEASKITFVVISGSTRAARERYVATAGQTVFNLANAYVLNENRLQVLVNGLIQNITYDYTETDTDTVTLASGVNAGDIVTFIQF